MRIGSRAGVAVLAVLALVSAAAVVLLVVRPFLSGTRLEAAVQTLPSSVQRISYTDWSEVSAAAGGASADSEGEVEDFLDRAFDEDLTVTSALTSTFPALEAAYGVTPLDAEWEVYGQAPEGAALVLRMSDDVDLAAVEGRLEGLGYEAPADGEGTGGTWVGTPDQIAGQPVPLTPLQENLAVLVDEHLLVMADDPDFVASAVATATGEEDGLGSVDGLAEMVGAVEDPATATVWVDDFACEDLAMSKADRADVADGAQLVEAAGGVHPLDGLVFAQQADQTLQFVLSFETEEQASADLQPRTDLASGPSPGQGGAFPDRFEVTSSTADGRLVSMTADPVADQVLLDVGQGPVLFATC